MDLEERANTAAHKPLALAATDAELKRLEEEENTLEWADKYQQLEHTLAKHLNELSD